MFKVIVGVAAACLLAGCAVFDFSGGPSVYDLPPAQVVSPQLAGIRVGAIRNLSGAGRPLLVRGADNRVRPERRALWLVSPEVALERSLRNVFLDRGDADRVLDVILQRFDFQETDGRKFAVLGVIYQIRKGRNWTEYAGEFRSPVSGEDYGAAMKNCVEESLRTLLVSREKK